MTARRLLLFSLMLITMLILAACNLSGQPEQEITLTPLVSPTPDASQQATLGVPTGIAVTSLPILTPGIFPTSVSYIPPTALRVVPTSTPSTISIVILSPNTGNIVSNNVQVLGSAIHPNFLQYQLEYGPEPNPGNLWYTIGGPRHSTVMNGVLGIWSTNSIPDGVYQLRLRVYLRDGSNPQTVVNSIRVQNSAPTVAPTATNAIPRPIAAFSVDRSIGNAPLVARFTNLSTGQISGYSWNFGDGSSSAEANPVHVFRTAGQFEVRLTVVGPGGQSNVSQIITVNVNPPVAQYEQSTASGPSPLNVQFTDRSTGDITTWEWDFGDGSRSSERNPLHSYTTQGTYNISLTVRGPGGTGRQTSVVTVSNPAVQPPVADFTPLATGGNAPLSIQFTDASTGDINSYLWDFGDSTSSTDRNPIHQFVNPGTYIVRLTVSGPGGTTNKLGQVDVTRAPEAPEAAFSASPLAGDAPLIVTFTNETTGTTTGYRWDFGDGTTFDTSASPVHTFAEPGTYTVILTALGEADLQDTSEQIISVTRPLVAPAADFTAQPTEGSAPLEVQFTNLSSGDDISSTWDFGDGATLESNESSITHTYEENGVYTVVLTVTGPGGPESTKTGTVNVTDRVQAAFSFAPISEPAGLDVAFRDESTGQIVSWAWDFGDGATSTAEDPVHTYTLGGTYTVTLFVTGSDAVTSSIAHDVTVSVPLEAPVAAFTSTVNNLDVAFTDQSTGQIDTWTWDLGDGNASSEQNPSHIYAEAGTYGVRLIVENASGSSEVTQNITVNAPLPDAPSVSFTYTITDLDVQFTAVTSGAVDSYAWDFGDGTTDTAANPLKTYAAAGSYNVTLTASNAGGANSYSETITVNAPLPDAPSVSFTQTTTDLTVQFTAVTSGAVDSYFWDFGDGTTDTAANPLKTYAAAGSYNVTLTASNAGGANSYSETIAVNAPLPDAPSVSFTYTVTDLNVQFTAVTSGAVDSYAWDFGDGTTDTAANPLKTYAAAGSYNVTLTASNAGGANSYSETIAVNAPLPDAPSVSFTQTTTDLTVQFTAVTSGAVDSYAWDFGDGTTDTAANPLKTYAAAGSYNVTLTASNTGGANSYSETIAVNAPLPDAPSVSFTQTTTDLTIQFTAVTSGAVDSYAWDFGDGTTDIAANPLKTYAAAGSYNVTLTASNAGGANSYSETIAVNAPLPDAPSVSFTQTTTDLTVQFTAVTSGAVDSYAWDFGDGTTDTTATPLKTYAAVGSYNVTLTASNTGGANSYSETIAVNAPLPDAPSVSFTQTTTDLTVQFTAVTSGAVDSYAWDFGDGTTDTVANPLKTYAAAGSYNVTLTASNAGGANSYSETITVNAALPDLPVADFSFSANELSVNFTDASFGLVDNWAWDFGDGVTSVDANPAHIYASANTYTVRLTVTNAAGSSNAEYAVTVTEPVETESIADTTPVMPVLNNGVISNIINSNMKSASAFVVLGDRSISSGNFLVPFGDSEYVLNGIGSGVDGVIQHFLNGDAGGINSFSRVGSAVFADSTASVFATNDGGCGDGRSVAACEIDGANAAITVISLGLRDARVGTNENDFRSALQTIVDTAVGSGSLPVLLTPYPVPGEEAQIQRMAEIVIEVAEANNLPVLNVWRLVKETPNALNGSDLNIAPEGADNLDDGKVSQFAENARNYRTLDLLRQILQAAGRL